MNLKLTSYINRKPSEDFEETTMDEGFAKLSISEAPASNPDTVMSKKNSRPSHDDLSDGRSLYVDVSPRCGLHGIYLADLFRFHIHHLKAWKVWFHGRLAQHLVIKMTEGDSP